MPRGSQTIPAAPFLDWLERRIAQLGDAPSPIVAVAEELGTTERTLRRYLSGLDDVGRPRTELERDRVLDMLDHADVPDWELYPELDEDVSIEPDAYCAHCHESVTPIDGVCPWCERPTAEAGPALMYCRREDAPRRAAIDGGCWRCGGELTPIPHHACACGCGGSVRRWDPHGREVTWIRGHAPRTQEQRWVVEAAPLRGWLEDQVRDVDPLEAVARRTGIARDRLVAILRGDVDLVQVSEARNALWTAARAGQGRGLPPRPGSTTLDVLYPDHARSKVCPDCGGGKAPHAQRCKACARKAGSYRLKAHRESSITEEHVQEALRLRELRGLSFPQCAKLIQPRTRCTNHESIANELRVRFAERGWDTSRSPRVQSRQAA